MAQYKKSYGSNKDNSRGGAGTGRSGGKRAEGGRASYQPGEKEYAPSFGRGGKNRRDANGTYAPKAENYREVVSEQEEDFCENLLEGRNPVKEAIKAGREIERILISNGAGDGSVREIAAQARKNGVLVQEVDRIRLDKISKTGVHQGIIAFVAAKEYCEVDDILNYAAQKGEDPFVFILDGITDPQNLGSIIRSAECAGVHGIIIPKRRAVGLTPVVAKASAGAIEYMRIAKVTNISQTIESLKRKGMWIFGAAMDGESCVKTNLCGSVGIVIGSEGSGISQNVRKNCDRLIALPVRGSVDSLNAAVSAGIIMYEAVRQRDAKAAQAKG
ncbi:MAG: 23S rRNA (guanosine(2251)-2'-O)-methyltransferase RlmB [Clostridia bacterium]|nr:23S rRNA (guanosine(2251)-2'-O)-methyltransferase RlmB [Clostridia bacterium]